MNTQAGSKSRSFKDLLTCKGYRQCLGKGAIALLVLALLTPIGREWALYLAGGGKQAEPKGWPWGQPWRDWDKPTDPRERAAYEYAHSLKLPDSLPKPVPFDFSRHLLSNRRATAAAYFDHLCKTEAGEFIFKTVDKVEGLYQMRAMPQRSDKVLRDRYGFEDPADWSQQEASGSPGIFLGGPRAGFLVFESYRDPVEIARPIYREHWMVSPWTAQGQAPYWRYHHFDNTHGKVTPVTKLEFRYAYTWRGIRRERDREFGIAGGELIVLDRITGEILGVRRSFAIAKQYRTHLDWEFAYYCPKNMIWRSIGKVPELNKIIYPHDFISQVLNPIDFDPLNTRSKQGEAK